MIAYSEVSAFTETPRHGNRAGVLLELAKRLQGAIHHLDYTFRLGGGRFAVLRPGSEASQARDLYERICADLAENPIVQGEIVSLSGGVAELVTRDDAESFGARAEVALQQAKANGRGTVAVDAGREPGRQTLGDRNGGAAC